MMKLRNKKTGEQAVLEIIDSKLALSNPDGLLEFYECLHELAEEWEDIAPLIQPEPLRKAVRAWADAHGIIRISYHWHSELITEYGTFYGNTPQNNELRFETNEIQPKLERGVYYSINDLCGEEE